MISTVSPSIAAWVDAHASLNCSTDSSPSSRRCVCTRSSKRFIATWRNTVAIWPSRLSASSASRAAGSDVASSSRPNVTVSPNTDAVSASVNGVVWWKIPCSRARYACRPWPISWASVSTSRRRAVQFSSRYGCCDGTVYAQNAPGRLPGRIGASIHDSSKKRSAADASSGENDA